MSKFIVKRKFNLVPKRIEVISLNQLSEYMTVKQWDSFDNELGNSSISFGCNDDTLITVKRFLELLQMSRVKIDVDKFEKAILDHPDTTHISLGC